jgi:hypothetical protein
MASLGEQLLAGETLTPSGDAYRNVQRLARAVHFDLDGVQAAQGPTRDDLPTSLVCSWQENQQLTARRVADTVEAAQLPPERRRQVGKRLRRELRAMCA